MIMLNRRQLIASAAGGVVLSVAGSARAQLVNKKAEQLKNGEFNWFPERSAAGPLLIIVSIPDQLVHVYRNGIRVAASTCSTGKPGHRTPTGVFKILQKDKHHKSSTYSNAPMPNMNRLTWSGIALHAGNLPGYPASHGCVRLPMGFSEKLFTITRLGVTVVLADERSQPASVVHPGMVLGDYAKREFAAVNASIKKSQYSEGRVYQPKATSVVVSGRDKSVSVWEDGAVVAAGKVEIENPGKPLRSGVHTLHGISPTSGELQWSSVGYGKGDREDLARELRRIKAEPSMQAQIRKRMHIGMAVVTTPQEASNTYRSNDDFVVIDGLY
jgi:hypothetical protein